MNFFFFEKIKIKIIMEGIYVYNLVTIEDFLEGKTINEKRVA